jgi:hypothetical protein
LLSLPLFLLRRMAKLRGRTSEPLNFAYASPMENFTYEVSYMLLEIVFIKHR